jgi:hypothetical protein
MTSQQLLKGKSMKTWSIGLAAIIIFCAAVSAGDLGVGTWKRDAAKTRIAEAPYPEAMMDLVRIEPLENGVKFSWKTVDSQGKAIHGEFAAKYDGKDYPIKGNPDADTVSVRRIDDKTVDYIYKKGGKEVLTERSVVSNNGKTSTFTQKFKNARGQDVTVVTLWNKH